LRYVIVNGDDLGLSPGVTRGILEAHEHGVVTSASLLVDRPATAAAADAVGHTPVLSVGLHVDLADADGRPLVDLSDPTACRADVERQVERFTQLVGRAPTHLDSHRNVHRQPPVRQAFREVAAEHGLPLREDALPAYVSTFYGQWDGCTHPEQIGVEGLIRVLAGLPAGWSEVGCHPGYVDGDLRSRYRAERELELATLVHPRVREAAATLDITFIGFADLLAAADRGAL
jgi:chitin disaccharide deacetylase